MWIKKTKQSKNKISLNKALVEDSIQKIKEIKNIENVGLIDKFESIKLNPQINIFYGLNASGKSSLYKAICNALGYQKTVVSNKNFTRTAFEHCPV